MKRSAKINKVRPHQTGEQKLLREVGRRVDDMLEGDAREWYLYANLESVSAKIRGFFGKKGK